MALFYSGAPVSHGGVRVSQHEQYQDNLNISPIILSFNSVPLLSSNFSEICEQVYNKSSKQTENIQPSLYTIT